MELTGTHLRYLLGIYQLSKNNKEIRLTEIANMLHVKKASVARIVGLFRQKDLVTQQPYGKLHLTVQGNTQAAQYERCVVHLADCLIEAGLLLDAREAYEAACVLLPELPAHCIHAVERDSQKVVDN